MTWTLKVLLSGICVCAIYQSVNGACQYEDGKKIGTCSGLMEESLALRNDLATMNKNCPIDSVYFYPNKSSNKAICGECIPTSSLFYDYTNNYANFNQKIVVCKTTLVGRQCLEQTRKSILDGFQCPVGNYCNSEGKCQSLTSHPLLGEKCSEVSHPLSMTTNRLTRWCGFDGLQCISGTCQICHSGVEYTDFGIEDHAYLQNTPIFTRRKDNRRGRRYCVNSQLYATKYDYTLLSDPYAVFVLIFAVVVLVIVIARDFMRFKNTKLAQRLILRLKLRFLYKKRDKKTDNPKYQDSDSDIDSDISETDDSSDDESDDGSSEDDDSSSD